MVHAVSADLQPCRQQVRESRSIQLEGLADPPGTDEKTCLKPALGKLWQRDSSIARIAVVKSDNSWDIHRCARRQDAFKQHRESLSCHPEQGFFRSNVVVRRTDTMQV